MQVWMSVSTKTEVVITCVQPQPQEGCARVDLDMSWTQMVPHAKVKKAGTVQHDKKDRIGIIIIIEAKVPRLASSDRQLCCRTVRVYLLLS